MRKKSTCGDWREGPGLKPNFEAAWREPPRLKPWVTQKQGQRQRVGWGSLYIPTLRKRREGWGTRTVVTD